MTPDGVNCFNVNEASSRSAPLRTPLLKDFSVGRRYGLSRLDAGSDKPHEKAGHHESAKEHRPIPNVELKKTTVCRNLHIREHD
jgi:hypothetical protein